jgi:hypothetical protein
VSHDANLHFQTPTCIFLRVVHHRIFDVPLTRAISSTGSLCHTVTHDSPHSTRTYTRRHYLSSARTTPNYSSPHSDILYLQKAWLKCGLSTHALRGT